MQFFFRFLPLYLCLWLLSGLKISVGQTPNPYPGSGLGWTSVINDWNSLNTKPSFDSVELIINRLLLLAASGDNYIVVLNVNITTEEYNDHLSWLESKLYGNATFFGRISRTFDFGGNQTFFGYSGTFNSAVLDLIKTIPIVSAVVRDDIVQLQEQSPQPQEEASAASTSTQFTAPWGLARISTRASVQGHATGTYTFNRRAGAGVDAYILDTGVYVEHSDFRGRAFYPNDIVPPGPDKNLQDDNGHGSHVAGIVGSNTYGVAKSVNIIALKVLGSNGRGPWSGVIAGIDYVVRKFKSTRRHSIINISISGPRNAALNLALEAAVRQGVHVVVAAGNDGKNACSTSPGSARNVISVGASTSTDSIADYSNFGSCVTINAPGSSILSIGTTSPTASRYMSGTSMASPHVAGALAVLLSREPNLVSPLTMQKYITSISTKNVLRTQNPGTRDLLYLSPN